MISQHVYPKYLCFQRIEINVNRWLCSQAVACAVCTLQLSLVKNVIIVFFTEKKKWSSYQNGPEVTEAGLVKMMFVFMTGKTEDGLEMLLIWFLVIMKWRRWRK